jgi:hypothetical protein
MKKIIQIFVIITVFSINLFGQGEKYHRVKILTPDLSQITVLASKGLAMESLDHKPGAYIIGEFSDSEVDIIKELGIDYEIIINDISAYYQQRNAPFSIAQLNAEMKVARRRIKGYVTPENFTLGSMGGYHNYQELLDELDEMQSLYPNLISLKQSIGFISTIQGRPVYWVRISNNPEVDQEKPKVLYTALTHAREPASLQQMLYQMWYLLENYDNDSEIQFLIDNLEIFFIPCVNPDGYIYNQTTNPNGGGMWRKNRRANEGGTYGVDLNRNYGYQWGYNDTGSSPYGSSETYRGTAPFSEPETQLVKQFCESREISLALNNHTYSDVLIYPWAYANLYTPDAQIFSEYAKLLTSENNYEYGTCYETLGYTANGGSDDWFYGEQFTKNKIFAFTPEAGSSSDGFWPAINKIEEICAGHTAMNLYLARFALAYASVTDKSPRIFNSLESYVPFQIRSLGQDVNATFTVSLNPISSNIQSVGNPVVFNNLEILETAIDSIAILFNSNISNGEIVKYVLALNNGSFTYTDTISKVFGISETIVNDPCTNISGWTSTSWGITTQHFVSAPSSINDSPGTSYANNASTHITLNQDIDLTDAVMAYIEFNARWDIEANYDYAQLMVSTDGGANWIPQAGQFTVIGGSNQDTGKPLYQGNQSQWVKEEISLQGFLGSVVKLRFRLVSDYSVTGQGFFFDDFKIEKMVASNASQLNLPAAFSFNQGSSHTVDFSQYISNFSDNLNLTWEGNQNIAIERVGWVVTMSVPNDSWFGTEQVTFTISGNFGESTSQVAITCIKVNTIPSITGQLELSTYKNEQLELLLDHILVDDNDNIFPDDFTLIAYDGDNYTQSNLIITPALNYVGFLTVPVTVSDGIDESEVFDFIVEVKVPVSIEEINGEGVRFFYSKAEKNLLITTDSFEQFQMVEIIDMQGRVVLSQSISVHSQAVRINLSGCAEGMYIVRLVGDKIFTGKIAI